MQNHSLCSPGEERTDSGRRIVMEEINSSVVGSKSSGFMNNGQLVIRLPYDNELLQLYCVDLAKYKRNEFFKYFSNLSNN